VINAIPDFKQWHEVYLSLSPYKVPWDVSANARYEQLWGRSKPQPTVEDLRLVIRFIIGQMRIGKRLAGSLRLYNLLDPDRFMYDLTDARHQIRAFKPPQTERAKILEAIGRPAHPQKDAVSAGEVLKAVTADDWKKLREALK
jgi:hypothetical protein